MRYYGINNLKEVKRGDIIRSKLSYETYVVESHYGNRLIAVSTADVTNPDEWEILK